MWVNPNPNFRKHNYNAAVEIKLHAWRFNAFIS